MTSKQRWQRTRRDNRKNIDKMLMESGEYVKLPPVLTEDNYREWLQLTGARSLKG